MITDPGAAPAIGATIMNPIGVTPVAIGTMTSATMTAVRAAGSVTPRVMRKRRDVAGNVPTTAKADGMATAKVIPRPHAAAGSAPTTATAAGTATPKAIPKRPAAVGTRGTARNVAMMTMNDRAVQAGETTNIEAVRGMMRIVVKLKAGWPAPMMTTTVALLRAAADMAAGRATPRVILREASSHAAVGKTDGNRHGLFYLSGSRSAPGLEARGLQMENFRHANNKFKGSRRAVLRHPQGHLLRREAQILRALPKMAKSASSGELSAAFEKHRQETEGHVGAPSSRYSRRWGKPARWQDVPSAIVGILGGRQGKSCEDYAGDLGSGRRSCRFRAGGRALRDRPLPRRRHLRTWGRRTGHEGRFEAARSDFLQEEIKTDQLLTKLATSAVNRKAA